MSNNWGGDILHPKTSKEIILSSYSLYLFQKIANAFNGTYHFGSTLGWASAMADEAARTLVHGVSTKERNRFARKVVSSSRKRSKT
jgi:hypothetical protein